MEKFYSKVEPDKLLHCVKRRFDIKEGRDDLIDKDNFIQCSALRLPKGKTFKPHRHNWRLKNMKIIAQESWVVLEGKVKCIFYDIDNTVLATPILFPGDASFTLLGGHNYELMEDSIVYEMKTGPYEGQEIDKTFI